LVPDPTSKRECQPGGAAVYRRRRPEQTVLHRIVRENLESYLALTETGDDLAHRVPFHVEAAYRNYLECGILAHGFARAYCDGCGHDFLIAFSCKGRDICPSCATRRMVETAAHMVDHVLPRVQFRQWVLSVPKRVRWLSLKKTPSAVSLLSLQLPVALWITMISTILRALFSGL
jgi:Transposase zinc-binding domain